MDSDGLCLPASFCTGSNLLLLSIFYNQPNAGSILLVLLIRKQNWIVNGLAHGNKTEEVIPIISFKMSVPIKCQHL